MCPKGQACVEGTGGSQKPRLDCAQGHYCPDRTQFATQFDCPPGTWTDSVHLIASEDCDVCDAGKFCIGGESSMSGDCPAGHYCPAGTPLDTSFPCPAGTYSDALNLKTLEECIKCPTGSYCLAASEAPTACPEGTYSPFENTEGPGPGSAPECLECTAGSRCPLESSTPIECGIGSHSSSGATICSQCPAGHFCASATTSTTTMMLDVTTWGATNEPGGQCFGGTFCEAGTSVVPTLTEFPCPAGSYCLTATIEPEPCPAGTYNSLEKMATLEKCEETPGGYYTLLGAVSFSENNCSPGYFCPPGSTSSTEVPCPRKFYRSEPNGAEEADCSQCVSGSYCPEATSELIPCPLGRYCPTGSEESTPCPTSTFGSSKELKKYEDCTPCTGGMFCDGPGLSVPRGPCDAGYYCTSGSSTSTPATDSGMGGLCPVGSYCPEGSSLHIPCDAGTYNNAIGSGSDSACLPCPTSQYCEGEGLSEPTGYASAGYFCNGSATSPTQFEAPVGHFTLAAASSATACLAVRDKKETE